MFAEDAGAADCWFGVAQHLQCRCCGADFQQVPSLAIAAANACSDCVEINF